MKTNLLLLLRSLSIIFFTIGLFFQTARAQYADLSWQKVGNFEDIGEASFIEHDFDEDGNMEIMYSSNASNHGLLKIMDYVNNNYEETYVSPLFDSKISWIQKYDLDNDGDYQLYIARNWTIEVMDLNTKIIQDTIPLPILAKKFLMVDIENDGTYEIAMLNSSNLKIINMEGEEIFSKFVSSADDLALGDVDGDGMEELIVTGADGYVIDLADFSDQWTFFGGFGNNIYLADIDGSGKNLIFGADTYDYITCFDAQLMTPLWQINVNSQITELEVHDLNNDGAFELIVGKYWDNNAIQCYNINNQTLIWETSIPNSGVTDFGVADFDGDNILEIVYGCGYNTSSEDILVVMDAQTQIQEYVSTDFSDGFVLNLDDVNEDEALDVFMASRSSNRGYDEGIGYIYDGVTKEVFDGPINSGIYGELTDVSTLWYEDQLYYAFLTEYRIIIYNSVDTDNEILNEYFGFASMIFGGFYLPEDGGTPSYYVIRDNGRVIFYDFSNNSLTETWSTISTNSSVRDYEIANMDTDPAMEIALLSNGIVHVYDLETHFLQGQYPLGANNARAFTFTDINLDGNKDILFHNGNNQLGIYNVEDGGISNLEIADNTIQAIEAINLDENPAEEIIILTEDRISIYDNEGVHLFASEVINSSGTYDYPSLKVRDIDNDQHMEILAATETGVYEYKLAGTYLDVTLPRVKNVVPIANTTQLSTNTIFEVIFTESISTESIEDKIFVKDQNENSIPFSTAYNDALNKLSIQPLTTWPSGAALTITLEHTITDPTGNLLDGNNNGVSDGIVDDYSWTIYLGLGVDEQGPEIKEISLLTNVFKGAPIQLSGYATDSSAIATSTIKYLEYFVDEVTTIGAGTPIPPLDEVFDQTTESFAFKIQTENLAYGNHTVFIVGQDALNNWGVVAEVTFNIIEEDPANWTRYSNNIYNTGANNFSDLAFPINQVHQFSHNNDVISKSIVVEDYLVYTVSGNNKLIVCRDINTGEEIWSKSFVLSEDVHPVSYAYGFVYVQLGDHSDSRLACYDITNGNEIWTTNYSVQWSDYYGPTVYKDKVYIVEGYYDSTIGAYDAFDGTLAWTSNVHEFDNYDTWQPAFYRDTVYGYAEIFAAMNTISGGIYYAYDTDEIPFSWPGWSMDASIVVDTTNRQLILTSMNYTHAFSMDNHSINWTITNQSEGSFNATPALYDGKLYVTSRDALREIDVLTGEVLWQYDIPVSNYGSQPTVSENIMVFANNSNTYIFDRNTRELKMSIPERGSVIISKNHLVHSSRNGQVRVFAFDNSPAPLSGGLEVIQFNACHGDEDMIIRANILGGIPPYEYEWNIFTPSNTNTISDLPGGNYNVTITDAVFNSIDLGIVVVEPELLSATGISTPENGMSADGTATVLVTGGIGPLSYEWAANPDINHYTLEGLSAGAYSVTITDANDCETTLEILVESVTGVHELENGVSIEILPTITNDQVTIRANQTLDQVTIEVYDLSGKTVLRKKVNRFDSKVISLGNYTSGYYLVRIKNAEFSITEKIILTK